MGRTRVLTDLYVLFFLTLILASPFFLYFYHGIEIGRLLVLGSDIQERVWTLQCFTRFRVGVQFVTFSIFFSSRTRFPFFFSNRTRFNSAFPGSVHLNLPVFLQDRTSPTNVPEIGQFNFVRSQNSGRGDVRSQKKLKNRQEKALLPQEKCKTNKKTCRDLWFCSHNLFLFFLFSNFGSIFFLDKVIFNFFSLFV